MKRAGIDRRTLLIGGGAGAGLIVAWAVWPRSYSTSLTPAKGETVFGAWLKIAGGGQITIAVPQAELGQGSYTGLPQILADELGADWRLVGVEAAPVSALYANPVAADALFADALSPLPESLRRVHATRTALMLTAASSSVCAFEEELQRAGAAARVLLCKAAAARWGVDWRSCGTAGGQVIRGEQRLGFGTLASEAAGLSLPADLPRRGGAGENRLFGKSLPRLDLPAKVDGSANFAGDIRLSGMVFASIRQGPVGDTRLIHVDKEAANRIAGVVGVVERPDWVAAVANNWWAANQALDALSPRFETRGAIVNRDTVAAALDTALDGEGARIASAGDLSAAFNDARVVTAEYRAGLALHAAIEPMTATATWQDGRLSLWMPTQVPGLARAAAASAIGVSENRVTIHPMLAGGSFGAKLEHLVGQQAAIIAHAIGKPVQLTWSRSEDFIHDRFRPAAAARMSARLGSDGRITGWLAKIAAPPVGRELARRLLGDDSTVGLSLALPGIEVDASAVSGAVPAYAIAAHAVDHHPAHIGVPVGHWRSGADSYTAFFTECFVDELARIANAEPVSYRISMLTDEPRLARCLTTVASIGEWQGGVPGSGQGVAAHACRGSYVAVLAEAGMSGGKVRVTRLVAAVDCGRMVNPDLVRQQIEGGLIFGMASAISGGSGFTENVADVLGFSQFALPRLGDCPDITIELIASEADPGGVGEIAVPPVGPAIANAVFAATGRRPRNLPFDMSDA